MRRYEPSDFEEMSSWYAAREAPCPSPLSLPEVGFIVPGVAAGFLYRTDSNLCLLEGFASNPDASPELRNDALDSVTGALMEAAAEQGFEVLVAIVQDSSIKERAGRWGFRSIGEYHMLARGVS